MIGPIKFEYEGVSVIIDVCWAGWKYEFDYLGVYHWAHHSHSWQAKEAAKNAIRKIKLLEAV